MQDFDFPISACVEGLLSHFIWWRGQGRRIFLLTSCWPDEGKTTILIELGRLLAQTGARVLLVDGDTRRPTLSHRFDRRGRGFDQFLESPSADLIQPLAHSLDLLGSGQKVGLSILPEVPARFRIATSAYQAILIDSPPRSACGDALQLAALCDSVLLVASRTRYRGVAEARLIQELASMGIRVEGVLLTREKSRPGDAKLPRNRLRRLAVWLGLLP